MILVVGVGRSGTSLVARISQVLGVFMGEDFAPPTAYNPDGYFEDLQFKSLTTAYLAQKLGLADYRQRLQAVAEQRDSAHVLWGFKDANGADVLPIWRDLWPEARYLCVSRDLLEVQRSMRKVYGEQPGYNPALIAQLVQVRTYLLTAWLPDDTLDVQFETLREKPPAECARIARYIYHDAAHIDGERLRAAAACVR